jgi:hypothetical protein
LVLQKSALPGSRTPFHPPDLLYYGFISFLSLLFCDQSKPVLFFVIKSAIINPAMFPVSFLPGAGKHFTPVKYTL